jgi:hypothetical protein
MTDMIERVAKAIDADRRGWALVPPEGATDENRWKTYTPIARAAIAAMREPSGEMLTAADLRDGICTSYDELWKTMIDAALEDE